MAWHRRWQAITCINGNLVRWRTYASLGLKELKHQTYSFLTDYYPCFLLVFFTDIF